MIMREKSVLTRREWLTVAGGGAGIAIGGGLGVAADAGLENFQEVNKEKRLKGYQVSEAVSQTVEFTKMASLSAVFASVGLLLGSVGGTIIDDQLEKRAKSSKQIDRRKMLYTVGGAVAGVGLGLSIGEGLNQLEIAKSHTERSQATKGSEGQKKEANEMSVTQDVAAVSPRVVQAVLAVLWGSALGMGGNMMGAKRKASDCAENLDPNEEE